MSNDNDTNDYSGWLDKYYDRFDYSDFTVLEKIDTGSSARIKIATLKDIKDTKFVLKCFNYVNYDKITLEKVVNEIRLLREVNYHPNIIRLYGITKDPILGNCSLVLEYADGGTLQNYLQNHIKELKWDDRFDLAFQIASAISCLHNHDIIHCDLHSANILVHQNKIKLADFGQSKKIVEASSSSTSSVYGIVPYVDPKSFDDKNYRLNKKSDVYSIGIIMWQISSGRQPFHTEEYDAGLMFQIKGGKREEIIEGTPTVYSDLCERCWKYEPDERPDIQNVVSILQDIAFKSETQTQVDNVELAYEENVLTMNNPSENYLTLDNYLYIDDIDDEVLNMMSFKNITASISNSSRVSYQESTNLLDSVTVDRLIEIIIEKHNEGHVIDDKIQQIIHKQIFQLNQNAENFVDWLMDNQNEAKYIWLLGLFYYYNILNVVTEDDEFKAFKLFLKASKSNFPIAQVYLANCYIEGYGTKKNEYFAFECYKRSVENKENKNFIGQFYLKYCVGIRNNEKSTHLNKESAKKGEQEIFSGRKKLRDGIGGAEKDEKRAFEFFEKSAGQGYINGIFRLAHCYNEGVGTKVDKAIAFMLYKIAAKKGSIEAQNNLGHLYEIGEGTKKCLKNAIHWYEKAADNGNVIAQYNLGICYEQGRGVEKDEVKAFEYYKKSAEQKYIDGKYQLANCYYRGIGTDISEEKAFKLYKDAAEAGYTLAQIKLGALYELGYWTEKDCRMAFSWYEKAKENEIALYNLGRCYEYKIGTEQDEFKAFEHYKKSADLGNINGMFRLGNCFDKGIGTDINKEEAFKLFVNTAEKGNPGAQNNLGSLYEKGEGTSKNLDKAFYWYKRAHENGNKEASYNLNRLQHKAIEDSSYDFLEI
uniref:Protein kinase domain-containing protein n=1 Tax=Rhizophagus irregularis (strain DAOM 181602 / DAOM 197198 / MUCL 43194) TaxID=747089 RepID=U9SRY6_RHIID